jgi:putative oxidoreductase
MKIVTLISRALLGLIFVTFGLNGFLNFIPMPPPQGLAAQFFGVLFASHYLVPIFLLQLIGGALLLVNRFVPLALAMLAPVIVNILIFHCLMAPEGLPLACITTLLWAILFFGRRSAFAGLFVARG